MNLNDYVKQHTEVKAPDEEGVDVGYFKVKPDGKTTADELKHLITEHNTSVEVPADFGEGEHPAGEIAEWLGGNDGPIGRKETALRLMGLGAALGLWHVNTPKSVIGAG